MLNDLSLMNWLAHLFLSEPTPAFRIGNLLPDMIPLADLSKLPDAFQRGIACHYRIDSFTDAHPLVRQSILRFEPPFRRYAAILTDVFYDHFLARDWNAYSQLPLEVFASEFYASFPAIRDHVPERVYAGLERMKTENWLCCYREVSGIRLTLERISTRLSKPFPLRDAVSILERHYDSLASDFHAFFPQLRTHVEQSTAPENVSRSESPIRAA